MNFMLSQIKELWLGLPPLAKIIILLLVILLTYSLVKKYGGWLKDKLQSSDISYNNGETPNNAGYTAGQGDINEGRKKLEDLSLKLYQDIYDTPIMGHDPVPYITATNSLSDNDLRYLADYYKKYLTKGTSLFVDMNDEVYPFGTDYDAKLISRLTKIGAK